MTSWSTNTVYAIDTATNTVAATVSVADGPRAVAVTPDGKEVYVAGDMSDIISVIDTATNTVTGTINVGIEPYGFAGIAVTPDGNKVYVTKSWEDKGVYVIDTATKNVTSNIYLETRPEGIAVNPDGTKVYAATESNSTVVIDTATNTITATVNVGGDPHGVAVTPDGTKVYVANCGSNNVSVIDTATNTVTATVPVGSGPFGVAVTPDGTKVYVANCGSNNVSVIDTATNTVINTVNVGTAPYAFGQFIVPPIRLLVASFSTNVTSGYAPLTVQFTDLSINATRWNWNFGDGFNSTEQNPIHTYSTAGNYTVNLTAINGNGKDSKLATITVEAVPEKPIASFSETPTSGNAPVTVNFTDTSTGIPTWWKWSFGDGIYSTQQNPVHTYNRVGKYTVSLIVGNNYGINYVTKQNYITVTSPMTAPVANFSATPVSGSRPLKVTFTDISTGSPNSWIWSFRDGIYSTQQNPEHTYSRAGKYNVSLTARNSKGSNTKTMSGHIIVNE